MVGRQGNLDSRVKAYASSSVVAVALGVAVAFLALRPSDPQGFFTRGLISLLFILLGGGLGAYCWRLLYLARKTPLTLSAYALGLTAALIPIVLVCKTLA